MNKNSSLKNSDALLDRLSVAFVPFSLFVLLFAPLHQLLLWGDLFYQNGEDENSYLNYEFAKATFGAKRLSSGLVILAHEIGLTGGWINFLLDTFSVAVISVCCLKILNLLFPSAPKAKFRCALAAILICPIIFSASNPFHGLLIKLIQSSDWLSYFFIYNHSPFPAILRSPESQLSIALLALLTYAIVRFPHGWVLLVLLPITYFFTGIYYFMVYGVYRILSIKKYKSFIGKAILVLTFFLLVSLAVGFLAKNLSGYSYSIKNHYPVLGLNIIYIFLFYMAMRLFYTWKILGDAQKNFIHAVLLGTLLALNLNIFSGVLLQPQHFELDGGIAIAILIGFVILFDAPFNAKHKKTWIALGVFIFSLSILSFLKTSYVASAKDIAKVKNFESDYNVKLQGILDPKYVFLSDIEFSSRYTAWHINKGGFYLSSIEPIFLDNSDYHAQLRSLNQNLSRQDQEAYGVFQRAGSQLEIFYSEKFLNFNRFEVLRRGGVYASQSLADPPLNIDLDSFTLMRVR